MVIDGGPDLGEGTWQERVERFRGGYDAFRTAVVMEPRGSEVVVGALLCKPVNPAAGAGVIFFNDVGYLGMAWAGTIGLVRHKALHLVGRLEPGTHLIDAFSEMFTQSCRKMADRRPRPGRRPAGNAQAGLDHHHEHQLQAPFLYADQPALGVLILPPAGGVAVDAHLLLETDAVEALVARPGQAIGLGRNIGSMNRLLPLLPARAPSMRAGTRWAMLSVKSCSPAADPDLPGRGFR